MKRWLVNRTRRQIAVAAVLPAVVLLTAAPLVAGGGLAKADPELGMTNIPETTSVLRAELEGVEVAIDSYASELGECWTLSAPAVNIATTICGFEPDGRQRHLGVGAVSGVEGHTFVFGKASPSVAEVTVMLPGGNEVKVTPERNGAFLSLGSGDVSRLSVTAHAADRSVLERFVPSR